jgi:hypothetical protein
MRLCLCHSMINQAILCSSIGPETGISVQTLERRLRFHDSGVSSLSAYDFSSHLQGLLVIACSCTGNNTSCAIHFPIVQGLSLFSASYLSARLFIPDKSLVAIAFSIDASVVLITPITAWQASNE